MQMEDLGVAGGKLSNEYKAQMQANADATRAKLNAQWNANKGGGYSAPAPEPEYYGGGGGNGYDAFFNMIKEQLEAERRAREQAAEANYKKLVAQAGQNYEGQRNTITKNNAYTQRWLKQQYGGTNSGQGLSQGLRAYTNLNNNLTGAREAYDQALLNAEADKYNQLASATNSYNNDFNNYVMSPILSLASSQGVVDDSFYRYIQRLGM